MNNFLGLSGLLHVTSLRPRAFVKSLKAVLPAHRVAQPALLFFNEYINMVKVQHVLFFVICVSVVLLFKKCSVTFL